MLKKIYLDTAIPSYATCRLRHDDHKINFFINSTLYFWENMRQKFNLFVSSYVLQECANGDYAAAQRRIYFLDGISTIPASDQIDELAIKHLELLGLSKKAKMDCSHLAASVDYQMDYLLSWNLKHYSIFTYSKILNCNEKHGLMTPLLLTPATLIEISQ
ncbi:MAG: hypothetical protein LBK52_06275 [Deltaproteobacteria bacterium]|jgi:hypothetical protein|nr:hypothetical protein [Deltaproteobacteria bacterium]